MLPTKSILDYMMEINRLLPRENDIYLPPTHSQFFNQSMARSSSSTDTSPESFSDTIGYRFPTEHLQSPLKSDQRSETSHNQQDFFNNYFEPFPPQQIYETPLVARQQRPIMARKLINENLERDYQPNAWSNRDKQNFWTEGSMSSPNAYSNHNMYYELFPSEGKEKQNESVKGGKDSYMSPRLSNLSPRSTATNMSPWTETMSEVSDFSTSPTSGYGRSPGSSKSSHARMPSRLSFQEPMCGPSTSYHTSGGRKVCSFCRRNGETPLVYTTHRVKEKVDGKYIVSCPILRSHVCATCGASGDDAHTKSYCPVVCRDNNGRPVQSTTVRLKNTRLKSNGTRRF